MIHPLGQIADVLWIVLISSPVLSIIVIALTIRVLLIKDVSRPWKIAGMGFILSMVATLILALSLFQGRLDGNYFLAFFSCYLASGILILASIRQLGKANYDQPSMGMG